jgi:hypothetical protein
MQIATASIHDDYVYSPWLKPRATREINFILDFLLLVFAAWNVGLAGASTRTRWQVQVRHRTSNIRAQSRLLEHDKLYTPRKEQQSW